jgi:hypothetical protein
MGKKCIPGIFCIENMTLFILLVLIIVIIYLSHSLFIQNTHNIPNITIISPNTKSGQDQFNNPYSPPTSDMTSMPVNVRTRGEPNDYQQIGILSRTNNSQNDLILPLMGRRIMSGRDKWQYYTLSGMGNLNTRLPVSVSGKSCTGEYGCDSINNGDTVYVEGYNDTFQTTVYENNLLQYIPSM